MKIQYMSKNNQSVNYYKLLQQTYVNFYDNEIMQIF